MYKLGRRQSRSQFFSELGVIVPRGTPDVRLVSVWAVKPLNPRIRYDEWPPLLLLGGWSVLARQYEKTNGNTNQAQH